MSTSPASDQRPAVDDANTGVVELDSVGIGFDAADGYHPLVTDVGLSIGQREILGLVGESGSGKSISALSLIGLLPDGLRVSAGRVLIDGVDVTGLDEAGWRRLRGPKVAMVFQDPMTSLDPCFRVGAQMVEAIRTHEPLSNSVASKHAIDLLGEVGIPDPKSRFHAFPHELSGGLRQRVMIAAALALEPDVLIADEPTTALDVTTQASILQLVRRLCEERSMGVLWITHDLGVVAELADRVAVMYAGELVESGSAESVFDRTAHHYSRGLIDSARHRPHGEPFGFIDGVVPAPGEWPSGCRFSTRCPAADEECQAQPHMQAGAQDPLHWFRCHHPLDRSERG